MLTTSSVTVGAVVNVSLLEFVLGGKRDYTRWELSGPVFDIGFQELQRDYGGTLNFTQVRFFNLTYTSCWNLGEMPVLWASENYYNDPSNSTVRAIFGTGCPVSTDTLSDLAREWNIPYMIPMVGGPGDKSRFPTITSLAPLTWTDMDRNASVITRLMVANNWTSVGYLCSSTGPSYECRLRFDQHSEFRVNKRIYQFNLDSESVDNIKFALDTMKAQTNVIVIVAFKNLIRSIMMAAAELGMTNGDYVFYAFDYYDAPIGESLPLGTRPWMIDGLNDHEEEAKLAYRSLFVVSLANVKTPEHDRFSQDVKSLAARQYNYTYSENENINPFAMSEYYAMKILGVVLNETVTIDGVAAASDGAGLSKRMWNRTYNILGRQIVLDENGDRVADWVVNQLDPGGNAFRPVLQWSSSMKIFTAVTEEDGTPRQIVWYNRTSLPADRTFPADNHDSTDSGTQRGTPAVAIGCSFMAVILLVAIVLAVFYRKIIWNKLRPAGFGIPPVLFRNEI
ncbi:putative Receptor-type guanylate cyclase gcy-28 [Hypsibius exemplaris]|uniref:Receptor-type guanylate cyclase gcy-28 n=1 Tax=Hypsibius exemplaris TaxID=2072580 RepID=A0A1W0XDY6_HYPEX|nr:putative Receptor-type guanylate cyclase gcy-28 [Hypsibius exemplaris]